MLRSESAFQQAKDALEKRFGNHFIVADAFRSKLESWPDVKSKDKNGIRSLSDFLQQCVAAAEEISGLEILNDIREIQKIASKLPEWMSNRWNRFVVGRKREQG